MTAMIHSCDIKLSNWSDHLIIEIKVYVSNFVSGRRTMKMNNSLLKNKHYLNLINKIIDEEKEKYCLPIFNVN